MKLLLIFALKINVLIHFDYAESNKIELSETDSKWVIAVFKKSIKDNIRIAPLTQKKIHGYSKGRISFFNLPKSISESITSEPKIVDGMIDNKLTISFKDFDYNLITKILNYPSIKLTVKPQIGIGRYYNSKFQQCIKKKCNDINALNSKPPKFEISKKWDNQNYLEANNCFNWATNTFNDSIFKQSFKRYRCDSVTKVLVEKNIFLYIGGNINDCPKEKREIIALSVSTLKGYHFFRRDDNGYWSHKDGTNMPSRFDFAYKLIKNPAHSHNGIYDNFCGYFVKNKQFSEQEFQKNVPVLIEKFNKTGEVIK